ncbi:succinate dehydrogenase, hydrophobic membrane anchor protein [Rhodomicrobium lacus]|jgi:succinate dehydrogenase / fumarate reductase membrane anchor subunit|uniref:succinate dehydrogenase, hydrophobic membrane anchor protein n=1 Tax=Rhodomicrobium TaxID=1068 RepID=UPI000F8E8D95|nr:succinate dehydrogenase, hydrophobic membrane anchor protein [Rhodomicrobium lacus]WKW52180.1 succinate dehydrogenase, hydrophobic membrane anchor protein [Rhodomicrobium lacus]
MPSTTYRTELKKVRGLGSAIGGPGTDHFWAQRLTAVSNLFVVAFLVYTGLTLAGAPIGEVKAFFGHPFNAIASILVVISTAIHMRLGMQVPVEEYMPHGLKVPFLFLNTFFVIVIAVVGVLSILKLFLGN